MVRKKLPPQLRSQVWNHHVGNKFQILCPMCQKQLITPLNFECGHDIAASLGGEDVLGNLKPICSLCNRCMGTKRWNEFHRELRQLEPINKPKTEHPSCAHCLSDIAEFLQQVSPDKWPNTICELENNYFTFLREHHMFLCTNHPLPIISSIMPLTPLTTFVHQVQKGDETKLWSYDAFFAAWTIYECTKE